MPIPIRQHASCLPLCSDRSGLALGIICSGLICFIPAHQVQRYTFQGEFIRPSKDLADAPWPSSYGSTPEACRFAVAALDWRLASSLSSRPTFTGSMSAMLAARRACSPPNWIMSSPSLNRLPQSRLPMDRTCTGTFGGHTNSQC